MIKDYFHENIEVLNQLRSEHFKVSEYLAKGKYRMKQKFFGKGKKHYDFDLNSQEFFHEYVDDIVFENTDVQEAFYSHLNKMLEMPLEFNYRKEENPRKTNIQVRNPSDARALLARHFHVRASDLTYKKYLTLLRLHNCQAEDNIKTIRARTNLIEKQIAISLERETRLNTEDYFETSYTQGGKPIPVNQNGQPIYKYLDEEQCWFSNISREDIIVYSRNRLYREEILDQAYWPIYYQIKSSVFKDGVKLCSDAQIILREKGKKVRNQQIQKSKKFTEMIEKELEQISPGNLSVKQDLVTFVYNIHGITKQNFLRLPLYPAIYPQLTQAFKLALQHFFSGLKMTQHQDIIALLPKLNNFCVIMFKYQNCQILQGQKQIKLGLDDDIDLKRELVTMLEELWVRNHVKINYQRFQYKLKLKPIDWELDSFSKIREQEIRYKNQNGYGPDRSLQKLIRLARLTNYSDFRTLMKKRSEELLARLPQKYKDMEQASLFSQRSDEEINLQKLNQMYKTKGADLSNLFTKSDMIKETSYVYFTKIIKNYYISNAAEIQILETLNMIQIREHRTKIMNILNGMRCYHRNIDLDLRVINGCQFEFELDDNFLINSNKQLIDNFEKTMKDTESLISGVSKQLSRAPGIENEDFLLKQTFQENMMYKKDIVQECFYRGNVPHVLVRDGKKKKQYILYDRVLEDLKLVEDRVLQFGTSFINRYQRILKIRERPQLADRSALLLKMYELEQNYLYEKFKLIQSYYYLYQNTSQPLNCYKIGKIIVSLIYQQPKVDLNQPTFEDSYELLIEQFRNENKAIEGWTRLFEQKQTTSNKKFHKKFTQVLEIPLTLWGYIYGDMEVRGSKSMTKLQRMNSVSSKMSRRTEEKMNIHNLRDQIKEEFMEDSFEEEKFDINQYDEYLLRRNMDDIFEDMIQQNAANKESGANVTHIGLQNYTVNPRYEGGPHAHLNHLPDTILTSQKKQKLINFYDYLGWISNIRHLISELQEQHCQKYGFCSKIYQLAVGNALTKKISNYMFQPTKIPEKFHEFQTDDAYHETVTKSLRFYEQTLQPILDPPSQLQFSLPSTHEKHQQELPSSNVLQHLDLHTLMHLIKLTKPANIACYRQLSLGIRFLEFIEIREQVTQLQLQREELMESYKTLATLCSFGIDKYTNCYGRTGQSEVFDSISEIKAFAPDFLKYPVLPETIKELRLWVQCEKSDLRLFRSLINVYKVKVQNYVRCISDIEYDNVNTILDRKKLLLSIDKKNVKMIQNRILGFTVSMASENLKTHSFLKYKNKIKVTLEDRMKAEQQQNHDSLIMNKLLGNATQKISPFCKTILQDKVRRLSVRKLISEYIDELDHLSQTNTTFLNLNETLKTLHNYINSLPYFSKKFHLPEQFQTLYRKCLYDQKNIKFLSQRHESEDIFYVYSREQLIDEWEEAQFSFRSIYLGEKIDYQKCAEQYFAPKNKDSIFKWLFEIPENSQQPHEKEALRHFMKVSEGQTGKRVMAQYKSNNSQPGRRNKFVTLEKKYTTLLQYIESNLLIISLHLDDDIYDSLFSIIQHNVNFEQRYPIVDESTIYERQEQRVVAPCFIYQNKKHELQQKLKTKISSRGYMDQKIHWAVVDEILDFIISKVQGYGVLRDSILPFKEELEVLGKTPQEKTITFMQNRTANVYKKMWLAVWETYLHDSGQTFTSHALSISDMLCSNNPLENFKSEKDKNMRRGPFMSINRNEKQKEKYGLGFCNMKVKTLVNRFKPILIYCPLNIQHYLKKYFATVQGRQIDFMTGHNQKYFHDFQNKLKSIGEVNRFKLFANIRYFTEKSNAYLSSRTNPHDHAIAKLIEKQERKGAYLSQLIQLKIQLLALTSLDTNGGSFTWQEFLKSWKANYEILDYKTFNVYDQLERYKESGKIMFSKSEMSLIGRNDGKNQEQYNKIIRSVIMGKLSKEEVKNKVLNIAISVLKSQKYPQGEPKKIINTSLIPRVHLIASYSSPLITERKTYISQQYKLAFVQAFINRFRNKVSRVDLLSSGYGFVITVPDLEDCVNFMNKLLFTFTEKEFRSRLDTFSQYYQILLEALKSKNKLIYQQQAIIKHLQQKINNTLEIEYLARVSKLLQEKVLIQDKLKAAEQASNGIEHRIRKTVQLEYDKQIKTLKNENEQLQKNFLEFQKLFVTLAKQTTKNNFLEVLNDFKQKISSTLEKKVDLSQSFHAMKDMIVQDPQSKVHIKQEDYPQRKEQHIYGQQDIQKCKIGQDIIHDPYYTTKLINKMRLFNVFKMGCKKLKFQAQQQKKTKQLNQLHLIQDIHIAQTDRQSLLREQLIKTQEELSKKSVEVEKLKHNHDNLENQKAKMKILLMSKEKKIEQKERELTDLKSKLDEKLETINESRNTSEMKDKIEDLPRISVLRQKKKGSSHRKVDRPFITTADHDTASMSLFDKFQLSSKDATWRQKCEQLYMQNKKLTQQLQKLKQIGTGTTTPYQRQGHSLNLRQKRPSELQESSVSKSDRRKFPNLAFKYNVIKQGYT